MTYTMTCTCGHSNSIEAANRAEAVSKFKAAMDENAIKAHMAEFHQPGEAAPTVEQAHTMIEASTEPKE